FIPDSCALAYGTGRVSVLEAPCGKNEPQFPDGCLCREIPAGSLFIRDGAATCMGSIGGVPSSHYLRRRKRRLHQLQQRNMTGSLFSGDVDSKHVGSNAGLCFLLATLKPWTRYAEPYNTVEAGTSQNVDKASSLARKVFHLLKFVKDLHVLMSQTATGTHLPNVLLAK
ncbi:hypothetical protein Tco_1389974, partial [Tanacetum coccineum]